MEERITVDDFIGGPRDLQLCDTGHVTNGAWAVLPSGMPEKFLERVKAIQENGKKAPLSMIVRQMENRVFYRVKPLGFRNDNPELVIYRCPAFEIGLTRKYIDYLKRHRGSFSIEASSPTEPVKLFKDGLIRIEIGILMPRLT